MKKRILAAATAFTLIGSAAQAQQTIEMTSAFNTKLPVAGTAVLNFANNINGMSDSIQIKVYEPGELVPALEGLDAVSSGSVDASYAAPNYWEGKIKSAALFGAVPFGPEAGEFLAWMYNDDGMKLYQRMYDENGYNVHAMPCGILSPETSGWFTKEINSPEDLKGLNMRFAGLGSAVMQKLGVSTSLMAPGDIFPALERGSIDATELALPAIDSMLGFYRVAKFNYFPGWHQPATLLELLVNKDVWNDLDEKAQRQIEVACQATITSSLAEGEAVNFGAMIENTTKHGVTNKIWSKEMLDLFRSTWKEVATEISQSDPYFAEVWTDLQNFREDYKVWGNTIYLPRPSN